MRPSRVDLVLCAALALGALAACRMFGMGSCPELPPIALGSGTYRALPAKPHATRDPAISLHGATDKSVVVDRAGGWVELRYRKHGSLVVERWTIKSTKYAYW